MNIGFKELLQDPVLFLAMGAGSGLSPKAPGTMGTVIAIPVFLILNEFSLLVYLSITLLFAIIGIYICQRAGDYLGVSDHPGIVWDEIVGFLITMILLPPGWVWIVLGFAAFRFFDILKPFPIGWLDRNIKGGLGVMADDVVAGVMACGVMHALVWSDWIRV